MRGQGRWQNICAGPSIGAGELKKEKNNKITHTDNEWDRFICNDDFIDGLPQPKFIDLKETGKDAVDLLSIPSFPKIINHLSAIEDKKSCNNDFWNWSGCHSWCQKRHGSAGSFCAYRGNTSGGCLLFANPDSKNKFLGFRPVLEINFADFKDC